MTLSLDDRVAALEDSFRGGNKLTTRLMGRIDSHEDKLSALKDFCQSTATELEGHQKAINSLRSRMDTQEDRSELLANSVKSSNELHIAHREALDDLTDMIGQMKSLLEVYNSAKSTIKVVGAVGNGVRYLAYFIAACAALYVFFAKGVLPPLA